MRLARSLARGFSTAASPTARNFSFSGCGFLIPYHLGVAQGLQDAGCIQDSSNLAANASMRDIHEETKAMARLCHSHGTIWKLEERLRAIFHTKFGDLPVKTLAQRLTIATEKMWPARVMVLTDDFHSTDDLCDALIASCYIPWYLAKRGTSVFRGDPGYVKVCAFHAHLLRRSDYEISPSIDPDFPFAIMQLARFAMIPPQIEVLDQLFELGQKSANIWVEKQVKDNNVNRAQW
ncbi:Acyl transferase/acyl hydrolase/lysophospholipase [Phytophthora cactorum]|nr:Acyl transferase/acyl hydrolase/lysophospholipase [Phytophthora cactorum]